MNKQTANRRVANCGKGHKGTHTRWENRDKKTVVARDDGGIREGHGFELFLKVSINGLQQMRLRRQPLREGTR